MGYVVAGLAGLWLLYILRRWCQYKLEGVQSDANRKVYAESMDAKPKPRFPICSYIISFFCTVEAVEIGFIPVVATDTLYRGVGANVDGPDLEANKPVPGTKNRKQSPKKAAKQEASKSDSGSDVDVVLSEESSYSSYGEHEYEDASSLSEEGEEENDGNDNSSGDRAWVEGSALEGNSEQGSEEYSHSYSQDRSEEQSTAGSVMYSLSSGGDRMGASDGGSLHSSDIDYDV